MRSTLILSAIGEDSLSKVKIAVLGDTGVGKSSLISVFSEYMDNPNCESFVHIVESSKTTIGKHDPLIFKSSKVF